VEGVLLSKPHSWSQGILAALEATVAGSRTIPRQLLSDDSWHVQVRFFVVGDGFTIPGRPSRSAHTAVLVAQSPPFLFHASAARRVSSAGCCHPPWMDWRVRRGI